MPMTTNDLARALAWVQGRHGPEEHAAMCARYIDPNGLAIELIIEVERLRAEVLLRDLQLSDAVQTIDSRNASLLRATRALEVIAGRAEDGESCISREYQYARDFLDKFGPESP